MGPESYDSINEGLEKFLAEAVIEIPEPVPQPPPPPLQVQQKWQQPGGFAPLGQHAPHALAVGGSSAMNRPYVEVPTPFLSPVTGANAQISGWKRARHVHGESSDSSAEKKKIRMIKNRESAARSRAKKQAYTANLEDEIKRLRTENGVLRKEKAYTANLEAEIKSLHIENAVLRKEKKNLVRLLSAPPPPEPKRKLRRTKSAQL